jgi:hypothetical protein
VSCMSGNCLRGWGLRDNRDYFHVYIHWGLASEPLRDGFVLLVGFWKKICISATNRHLAPLVRWTDSFEMRDSAAAQQRGPSKLLLMLA